jgi:DNA-binding HxlR family transcriptional regulator
MYRPKREPLPPCPVENALAVVAGKWKARILLLLSNDALRFSDLRRNLEGITQQVLSAQLNAMERDGIVLRSPVSNNPLAGSPYALTEDGRSLLAALEVLSEWGMARLRLSGQKWDRPGPVLRVHSRRHA